MNRTHSIGIKRPSALVVENLSKRFRGKPALDGVSFEVPKASLTVILGPAGTGKTTTLRLIAGLDRPDSGRVLLFGEDVGRWEPKDRNISMIFDNLALYPNKTGFENIASPLIIRRESKQEIEKKVEEMAGILKISHILKRLPRTMSGGERQRIALGRALIRSPNLFLLDEPLSSLDAKLRIELRTELKRLQRDLGYTFVLATPDYTEAMAIADTVVMLHQGRAVQVAEPQELYDKPIDRETACFVGAPQINLVDASYEPNGNGGYIKVAEARLPAPPHLQRAFSSGVRDFELGIRPEHLRMGDPSRAQIRSRLVDIEPLGLKSVLTVQTSAVELRLLVKSKETREFSIGQNMGIETTDSSMFLAFDRTTGRRIA
ncbi:ABC transporter, ATP-binding protein [delta proteobacterium NaphS2]|nr:ABC transporter, ATP-binding protein [delta proteobacterium NaphS2]